MTLDFELLYDIYTQDFISLVKGEDFYTEFMNKARSGNSEVSYMHRFIDKQIDLTWIEAIEEAIIPLDNIIRNPRRFIVQEEEIVNIELARKISPESIRHLAQHTNMIAKVEDDTVTPNRILNIFKEESFEIDPDNDHFYIPEDMKYMADIKFESKGTTLLGAIIFTVIMIIVMFVIIYFLPDIFGMIDSIAGGFSNAGKSNIL